MQIVMTKEVANCLALFDARTDTFGVADVATAVEAAAGGRTLTSEQRLAVWPEWAAFAFDVHPTPDGGPWRTYFQPQMTRRAGDVVHHSPDLRQADTAVIAYWSGRARTANHPILVARYADLVWDFTRPVTSGRPPVEFARRAIDAYVAAIDLDGGNAWGDNFYNIPRVLSLAQSIRDETRVKEVVRATISYADRTARDDKLGTYAYLFDYLLPRRKGPPLTSEQESQIVGRFERVFTEMMRPEGPWKSDPYSIKGVGERLAAYYARTGRDTEASRTLTEVALAFERRAEQADALSGMLLLEEARSMHARAGRRDEVERVQAESQRLAPAAEAGMQRVTVSYEVTDAELETYLVAVTEGGPRKALARLAIGFIPDQKKVAGEVAELARRYPAYGMFADTAKVLGESHFEADIGDDAGDPDGRMVYHTAQRVQLQSPWVGWVFDRLFRDGMTVNDLVSFVQQSSLFEAERLPLIRQAVEAHVAEDYVKSIHALVPQIERALVRLPPVATGKPNNKPHRSARGFMQFQSLNDVLEPHAWPVKGDLGENFRMYLLSVLAHPKGMNVRNDVCHGLWPPAAFTRAASERLLHVLVAVAMLNPSAGADVAAEENTPVGTSPPAAPPPPSA
jgi:lysyl-tRNA synthetase class 1